MVIKKSKITQLSNEDKRGNVKYYIECGNCGEEIDVRFGQKINWSSYCPHCKELYNVSWK
jgi:predicted Zn-ribbon and HTH transcriptional regulator